MVVLLIMVTPLLSMLLAGMVNTNGIGVHAVIGGCQRNSFVGVWNVELELVLRLSLVVVLMV